MQLALIVGLVCLFVGLAAGTLWGRKIEQKAVSTTLLEFRLVDDAARQAVNRLWRSFPYIEKYFGNPEKPK
jgi:hypothetical protein